MSSVLAAYHLELIVSATLSLLAVVAVRFREATPESIAHAPPMLRTAIVSFFAVLGSILALRDLDEVAGGLAVTVLAALALANFVVARRPLISVAFVSAFLKAFLGCLLIWWVVIFTMLPLGIERHEDTGRGFDAGAPKVHNLKKKLKLTTVISAAILAVIWILVEVGVIRWTEWFTQGFKG